MKKYFLTGLVSLLPLAITLIIFYFVIDILTAPFVGAVEDILLRFDTHLGRLPQHKEVLLWISRFIVLIGLVVFIFFLGFITRRFFFHYFVNLTHKIFSKIPLIRTIYKATRQITEAALSQGEKFFKQSVLVKFPHSKATAMGFLTSRAPSEVESRLKDELSDEEMQSIFVPTSPHPISGFLLMMGDSQVRPINASAEDVFKFLVSCGVFHPEEKP